MRKLQHNCHFVHETHFVSEYLDLTKCSVDRFCIGYTYVFVGIDLEMQGDALDKKIHELEITYKLSCTGCIKKKRNHLILKNIHFVFKHNRFVVRL